MAPKRLDAASIASALPQGGITYVQGGSAESLVISEAIKVAGDTLGAKTFMGIFVPGLNTYTYLANPDCRTRTFFVTPQLKEKGAAVEFLPLCYGDILDHLRQAAIESAVLMVSPPDGDGMCSFGPAVDFQADLWERIPVRVAHINPSLPRTRGCKGIPFSELTAYVEADQPMLGGAGDTADGEAAAIGARVAHFVPDGATLQTGLGKVPSAVLRALVKRRRLRVHSGLIAEAVLDLEEAGALAEGVAVTGGVAIGSHRLYAAASSETFEFKPVSYTHNLAVIAGLQKFVSINSALEADLFGQAYAEMGPKGLLSGPGGASDFARGAKAGGGLRIVALPATAKGGAVSRIIAPGCGAGPVSLGRMDTDIVVTEYGAADLRGLSHERRAEALIGVAAPNHRGELEAAWRSISKKL